MARSGGQLTLRELLLLRHLLIRNHVQLSCFIRVKSAALTFRLLTQMFRSVVLLVMVGASSLAAATDGDVESKFGTYVESKYLGAKLQLAATEGDLEGLRILIAAGAPLEEAVPHFGLTPLHLAAQTGHAEVLEALVGAGASLSARDVDGDTPLHLAAVYGKEEAISVLCAAGASHKALNKFGSSPLHMAASNDEVEAIRMLLAAGAALEATNRNRSTPLHAAAGKGLVEAVKALLAAGASLEARTSAGATPMALAAKNGHAEAHLILRSWLPAEGISPRTSQPSDAADLALLITTVIVAAFIATGSPLVARVFFPQPTATNAAMTILFTVIAAVTTVITTAAAVVVTPFEILVMIVAARNRLFDGANLTTLIIAAAALFAIHISVQFVFGSGARLVALAGLGRAPVRAATNAAAKKQKSRSAAPATRPELARREKAATQRGAVVAAEQQIKGKANQRKQAEVNSTRLCP